MRADGHEPDDPPMAMSPFEAVRPGGAVHGPTLPGFPPTGTTGSRPTRSASPVQTVDRDLLAGLRGPQAYPSVSVLLPTTPGPVLASGDVVRLHGLLERAQRRLSGAAADQGDGIVARLRALAVAVRRSPTGHGLALFASPSRAEAVRLEVRVDERVVIGPAFATRDLLRAIQAAPRYRLLVLSERHARLF